VLAFALPDGWQARVVAGRLRELSTFGVETRYPVPFSMPGRDDVERAVTQAAAVVNVVARDLQARGLPITMHPATQTQTQTHTPPASETPDNGQ